MKKETQKRIADAVIWALIGCFVFLLAVMLILVVVLGFMKFPFGVGAITIVAAIGAYLSWTGRLPSL